MYFCLSVCFNSLRCSRSGTFFWVVGGCSGAKERQEAWDGLLEAIRRSPLPVASRLYLVGDDDSS